LNPRGYVAMPKLVAALRAHDRRGPTAACAHEIHPTFSADMIPTAVST
jgi:hypothetical protein